MEEAKAKIGAWLKAQDYALERVQAANATQLDGCCSAELSLLAEKRAVECTYKGSLQADFGEAVRRAIEKVPKEDFIYIITGRIEAKQRQTKWYKQLENSPQLLVLPVWPPEASEMPLWLQQHLQEMGVKLADDAQKVLLEACQGNPAAIAQTITKLQILHDQTHIWSKEELGRFLMDDARFSPMDLVKAILRSDTVLAASILDYARQTRLEVSAFFWTLIKEVRLLLALNREVEAGVAPSAALTKHNVWFEHRDLLVAKMKNLNRLKMLEALCEGQRLEVLLKSSGDTSLIWQELKKWCFTLLDHSTITYHEKRG